MRMDGVMRGAVLVFLATCLSAKAESVTYSFFGSAWLQGTDFTFVSPTGFLGFDTGPLVPTTASDVFFYDVNGAYFKNDIGALVSFDFVSEDELLLKTTGCTLAFTLSSGNSHVLASCPASSLDAGSSISGSGYLLDVFTNFDVVGTGEIGIAPTETGVGGQAPEPSGYLLAGTGCVILACLRKMAKGGR